MQYTIGLDNINIEPAALTLSNNVTVYESGATSDQTPLRFQYVFQKASPP